VRRYAPFGAKKFIMSNVNNTSTSSFAVRVLFDGGAGREVVIAAVSKAAAIRMAKAMPGVRDVARRPQTHTEKVGAKLVFVPWAYVISPGEAARRERLPVLAAARSLDERVTALVNVLADNNLGDGTEVVCSWLSQAAACRRDVQTALRGLNDAEWGIIRTHIRGRAYQGQEAFRVRLQRLRRLPDFLSELVGLTADLAGWADRTEAELARSVSKRLAARSAAKTTVVRSKDFAAAMARVAEAKASIATLKAAAAADAAADEAAYRQAAAQVMALLAI